MAEWSDVCMHFALNILEFCILLKKKKHEYLLIFLVFFYSSSK